MLACVFNQAMDEESNHVMLSVGSTDFPEFSLFANEIAVAHVEFRWVMSPILKRDISEHVRHARRLVAAATGQIFDDRIESAAEDGRSKPSETYASGSSPRQGIGVYEDDRQKWYAGGRWEREDRKGKGKATDCDGGVEASDEEVGERGRMLFDPGEKGGDGGLREELEYGEVELGIGSSSLTKEKWNDLRNLLLEVSRIWEMPR